MIILALDELNEINKCNTQSTNSASSIFIKFSFLGLNSNMRFFQIFPVSYGTSTDYRDTDF